VYACAVNEDQIAYWNGPAAARWTAQQSSMDRALAPFSAASLQLAAAVGGERALDVGCGCGDTALALAQRVGTQGRVIGVDVSGPMLARARERAAGLTQLEFVQADAATASFTPDHDLLFSRFGVMFFEDAIAAFDNLHRALRPSGRLAFVCWRAFEENPWATHPMAAIARVLPETQDPWRNHLPGPYAFADRDKIAHTLSAANFHAISIERFDAALTPPGDDVASTVDFTLSSGPATRLLAGVAPELVTQVREELLRVFTEQGSAALAGSSWLVHARASA
jgi:ubiquinone/menaquinone biosynthesis C-methylase UbiE